MISPNLHQLVPKKPRFQLCSHFLGTHPPRQSVGASLTPAPAPPGITAAHPHSPGRLLGTERGVTLSWATCVWSMFCFAFSLMEGSGCLGSFRPFLRLARASPIGPGCTWGAWNGNAPIGEMTLHSPPGKMTEPEPDAAWAQVPVPCNGLAWPVARRWAEGTGTAALQRACVGVLVGSACKHWRDCHGATCRAHPESGETRSRCPFEEAAAGHGPWSAVRDESHQALEPLWVPPVMRAVMGPSGVTEGEHCRPVSG